MSEEEKKALKYLRKNVLVRIDIDENGKEKIVGYGNSHKYIILKLIKRQQEKIASLQKEIKLMKSININDNYISKDKIRKFIKNELPDDEICKCCNNYDVNGVKIKEDLEELLKE